MGFLSKRGIRDLFMGIAVFLAVLGLILKPQETVTTAQDGLKLCYNVIIPTLFPFFVLSSLLVELGLVRYLGRLFERIMRPLFNVGGVCSSAFVLGFIGGYPTGARTALSLYEKKLCTKTEAERMLSFCNNSGPAFILGVVGAGIFSSSTAGVMLYLAHIAASIIVGIIFGFYKRKEKPEGTDGRVEFEAVGFTEAFIRSVKSALASTLNICAFVLFFTVTIKMLVIFGVIPGAAQGIGFILSPVGIGAEEAEKLLTGLFEVSSGVWSLKDAAFGMRKQLAMAAFMLGWAGISVHCQTLSFIGESGLSTKTYMAGKILHGAISAALVFMVSGLFGFNESVPAFLAEQISGIGSLDFSSSLRISMTTVAVMLAVMVLPMLHSVAARRRRERKETGHRL